MAAALAAPPPLLAAMAIAIASLAAPAALAAASSPPASSPWPAHPTWAPTYDMNMSTMMMPCNTTGWFDAQLAAKYGIADFVRPHLAPIPPPPIRSARTWRRTGATCVTPPGPSAAR